ncbi:uncharacterized protein si:dkey-75a21.2 [Thalassophryne amazonica]|uniref:uncharacterized protein si:dkey-75a21.2 n=1 Tax=Thalassophryne amazonica TaxID=390379 RepID=UPI001471EA1E|nr:uncharacterized protein si:dkey-75a21.2 [Thalassophryne amazonica]
MPITAKRRRRRRRKRMATTSICACERDNRSIDHPEFSQLKAILPSQYEYRLCCFKDLPSHNGFSASLHRPIGTHEEAMKWKREFQEVSKTTLRLAKTYPHVGQKVIFKEDLHCQHNTRSVGKARESTRPSSKDTQCSATMTIVIKRTGINIKRSTDGHLPKFPMIVNMKYIHNHPVNCADALRHQDVSDEVKKKFLDLFEAGHSPSSALEIHKFNMQLEHQDDFVFISADRAKIPDLQWCKRLYYSAAHKAHGGGTPDSGSAVQEIKGSLMAFSNSLMSKVENDPATFLPAIKTFLTSSQKLKTDSALISALHTFGKYSGAASAISSNGKTRLSGLKRIGVQPTAVAHRKKAALGGRKCLSNGRPTEESP